MTDEPLVVPVSPGAALVRLAQVGGVLQRHAFINDKLPVDTLSQLHAERDALWQALESNEPGALEAALRNAQNHLHQIYETLRQTNSGGGAAKSHTDINPYQVLGFPDPADPGLEPVDIKTVLVTFSKPIRQVLTTFSFQDAAGATAYWLQEIRTLGDERLEDFIVESNMPLFPRLRIPVGPHTFMIQTRNNSEIVDSAEFSIEVPAL